MMLSSLITAILCLGKLSLGDEYRIKNADELIKLSKAVNSGTTFKGTTVLLDSDITFSKEDMERFNPIGIDNTSFFLGTFDGQGHTLSNFVMKNSLMSVGLFGYSEGMTAKNIVVDASCYIESSFTSNATDMFVNIGSIIGGFNTVYGPCILENIVNMADISYTGTAVGEKGTLSIGGIAGNIGPANYPGSIKNCANYGTLTHLGKSFYASLGGISGAYFDAIAALFTNNPCIIQNNFNAGKIVVQGTADNMLAAGGIIGATISSEIENCVNYGTMQFNSPILALGTIVGGFTGKLVISNCYWLNTTDASNIYGFSYSPSLTISNSYSIEPDIRNDVLDTLNDWATENYCGGWMTLYTNVGIIGSAGTDVLIASKKVLPDPKREGHSFVGWCTNQDCTDGFFNENNYENVTELYAQWTINKYTVFFDFENGTVTEETYTFNETIKYPEGKFVWDTDMEYMPGRNLTIKIAPKSNNGSSGSSSAGLIAGCISGAVILAVVICVVIFFVMHYDKDNTNDEIEMRRSGYRFIETDFSFHSVNKTEELSVISEHTVLYPGNQKVPTPFEALIEAGLDKDRTIQVINECMTIGDKLEESGMLYNNFSKNDAVVVAMYTFDFGPGMAENNPYRIINKALVSNDEKEFQRVRGLIFIILKALRKLPKIEGKTLYRGTRETVSRDNYNDGEIITWTGFFSTSPDVNSTKELMSKSGSTKGTLFVIEDGWGYDIQPFSRSQDEEEILLEPGRRFEVKGVIESDMTIISLRMLDTTLIMQ